MSTLVGVGTVDAVVVVDAVVDGAAEEEAVPVACGFAPSLEQLATTSSATTHATLRAIRATLAARP